ncbi:MAG TPA: homocysteine S-methyltransferase family protein [Planctomycetota bacterium]|nr:homocysteine S-methyltransferase family protein [Planctomycetota bacterium]
MASASARLDKFKEQLASGKIILSDGAWGTQMQKLGLQPGDCPEEWNVSRPDDVRQIAREYLAAGADFCLTNTFGANKYRLVRHGYAEKVREFNLLGAMLSRQASDEAGKFVAASVGPTGEFVQPEGMLTQGEMLVAFREQIEALKEGGVDAICIETMYVLDEALLAIQAAKECGLFCMATMTFDATPQGFKTMMGTPLDEAARALDASPADIIGTNCGNGIEEMVQIALQMRPHTKKPLLVKSNAGLPKMVHGISVYKETPQMMAARIADLKTAGVAIIGGCCGTTPEHIRAFRAALG